MSTASPFQATGSACGFESSSPVIVVCAWCKKWLEEIEPLDDESLTHGICKDCQRKQLAEVEKMKRNGLAADMWGGAKAGYYTYRAGRLEGDRKSVV